MNPILSRSALALALAAALCACSSDDTSGTGATTTTTGSGDGGGGGTTTGTGGEGTTTGTGGNAPECPGPGAPGSGETLAVESATADIVDLDGNPVAGVLAYVCGLDLCTAPTPSNGAGHVVVDAQGSSYKQPAFKYGDALTYARFALPITEAAPVLGDMATVALPSPGVAIAPGDVTSGGVTLTVEAGTYIEFALDYDSPEKQTFRAANVPITKAPPAVDPALDFEIVYGVAPVDTILCPAVAVTVPNDPAWPAGTAVEFWIHGFDVGEDWAPYGGWAKVSDGEVSADGTTVRTSAGGGLNFLSTFAVRKK